MYTRIRIFIKQHFPHLYVRVRNFVFPYFARLNEKTAKAFTSPVLKSVSIHGVQYQILLDPQNGFVDTTIFTDGTYEPDILLVIQKHLPKEGTFIDIGANIGQHSIFAATHIGPTGKVIAFEPIPRLVTQIKESIAANTLTNVVVHRIACSDTTETLSLKMRPGNIGGSGFHHDGADFEAVTVQTQPADEILVDEKKIDFIKIDTEGHELEVLQGLANTLKRHRPTLLIEYSPSFWTKEREQKSAHFFEILNTNGYTCYDLEAGHAAVTNTTAWYKTFNKLQTNLLCMRI